MTPDEVTQLQISLTKLEGITTQTQKDVIEIKDAMTDFVITGAERERRLTILETEHKDRLKTDGCAVTNIGGSGVNKKHVAMAAGVSAPWAILMYLIIKAIAAHFGLDIF